MTFPAEEKIMVTIKRNTVPENGTWKAQLMETATEKRDSVRAVDRAIEILQAFTFEEPNLTLAQICEVVALPKTTVYRSLVTLEQHRLVVMDAETGKYHLGYEMIKFGAIAQETNSIGNIAKDEMMAISKDTQQTCNIYIREGYERLCIAQIAGSQYVRRYSYLGARYPLYCGAGKLLLAYAGAEFQERYFGDVVLERFTDKTTTDKNKLKEELLRIRENGYSVTLGERDAATAMVAMPLFDYTNRCIAAITISGPVYFFTDQNVDSYVKRLRVSARRISQRLGYSK